jgi:hypothetical protein
MKTIYGLFILSMCGIATIHAQTEFDLFPLKKNLHYSYDYYSKQSVTQSLITWTNAVDSGMVDYIVGDSLRENDTTVIWSVMEIKNLHRWSVQPQDTSYNIHDTTFLSLSENTGTSHALRINGIVWSSNTSEDIYRYDSSEHREIRHDWSTGAYPLYVTTGTDSLAFRDGLGMSYKLSKWNTQEGLMGDGEAGYTVAQLRNSPVTHADVAADVIAGFQLKQNFPNPFNPETTIEFELPSASFTTVTIYDILGRKAAVLLAERLEKGSHSCVWNASRYPSGVYFYCLHSGTFRLTKKLLLQK